MSSGSEGTESVDDMGDYHGVDMGGGDDGREIKEGSVEWTT